MRPVPRRKLLMRFVVVAVLYAIKVDKKPIPISVVMIERSLNRGVGSALLEIRAGLKSSKKTCHGREWGSVQLRSKTDSATL
jgi:hypothetical protein